MRGVILVPRRAGVPERDRIWEWARKRWAETSPSLAIYEGHHDIGPFNRSAALNAAARLADEDGPWDLALVIDADIFIARRQVRAALKLASSSGRVTWAHRRWRGISEEATARLLDDDHRFTPDLAGEDLDLIVERTNPISWSCCFAVPRAVWDALGGFDERFRGWGFEDMAWQSIVVGLHGHERIEGDVYHLWHPRSDERIVLGRGAQSASPDYLLNARLGRRYMYAVRRDYGLTDRPTPTDAAEMERDLANLKRDDARLSALAKRLGLPDWDEWWPTLEELRDGRTEAERSVTLAVHTDGRRDYIEPAIASLLDRVSGPIVKRVIYDDSGDPAYKAWLAERFPAFYVVGPAERLGYTGSMRALWSYLRRKCSSPFVFLAEDDFTYDRPVDLDPMIDTLRDEPHLRQIALLRHAYYPAELDAGGIIAQDPGAYELRNHRPHPFIEHRSYFTANPSLFRRELTSIEWPSAQSSERVYTNLLNRDPASRFAYWGSGEEWVTHIGAERAGTGY